MSAITQESAIYSNKAIVALLYKLMGADHDEDPHELAYIMHIGERLGLSDDILKEVSFDVDSYELEPPSDKKERITILYYFLFLMKADGLIQPEEEDFVIDFGKKLGFQEDMIVDLIEVLKEYVDTAVPPQEMYSRLKKYL